MSELIVPERTSADNVLEALKDGLSYLPILGFLAGRAIPSPYEKRIKEFHYQLLLVIDRLQKSVEYAEWLTPEKLAQRAQDEDFLSAYAHIITLVMRNHEEEKLKILRNVLLNTLLPNEVEDDIQQLFRNLIGEFGSGHIHVLRFFAKPKWFVQLGYPDDLDDLGWEFYNIFPKMVATLSEFSGRDVYLNKIIADLSENRLITLPNISLIDMFMSGKAVIDPDIVTDLGRAFLNHCECRVQE